MIIKRSFARKITLKHYGGLAFETADFSCERETEWENEDTSADLHKKCKEDVLESIKEYVKVIQDKNNEETSPEINVTTEPFK